MVEHSLVVNEEANEEEADYLKALQSAKFDRCPLGSDSDKKSGECDAMVWKDGSSGGGVSGKRFKNNLMGFNQEEDKMIEKTLLQIRDRIRSGQPLSH